MTEEYQRIGPYKLYISRFDGGGILVQRTTDPYIVRVQFIEHEAFLGVYGKSVWATVELLQDYIPCDVSMEVVR